MKGNSSELQAEYEALAHVKHLARASLGIVAQVFGPGARDQQELLGHAANIIIECYAIESAVGRAEKMNARRGERAAIAVDMTRVYTCDAIDRAAHAGKQILNALGPQQGIDRLRSVVAHLNEHPGTDSVAARRRIADAAIAQSRYPF